MTGWEKCRFFTRSMRGTIDGDLHELELNDKPWPIPVSNFFILYVFLIIMVLYLSICHGSVINYLQRKDKTPSE